MLKLSRKPSILSDKKDSILPLCEHDYEGFQLAVCGMGYVNKTTREDADVLQELKVDSLSQENCPSNMSDADGSIGSVICMMASNEVAGGVCSGDSGGPVYPLDADGEPICLYGIVSYGWNNCTFYSAHTRIPYFLDWIETNIEI
ncbi:mite allergen Der f 3-like [Convolutriloba macropyga]|uniref:mite allergen Der f 3-like n=1 Tax=Convolutriloba macropyga TaxID=536237 RepID=UPI003F524FEF